MPVHHIYTQICWSVVSYHSTSTVCVLLTDDSIVDCNFESECVLQQDQEDDEDWVRMQANNLPGVRDHTLFSGMHDDVIKWKHFPRYWSFVRGIHRSPVDSPHKGQWRGALIFSLMWAWTVLCGCIVLYYDIHLISDLGHLLCVLEFERSTEATARLYTTYKNTTGMCLELRYQLKLSSAFKVIVRGEDYLEQELQTRFFDKVLMHHKITFRAVYIFVIFEKYDLKKHKTAVVIIISLPLYYSIQNRLLYPNM